LDTSRKEERRLGNALLCDVVDVVLAFLRAVKILIDADLIWF